MVPEIVLADLAVTFMIFMNDVTSHDMAYTCILKDSYILKPYSFIFILGTTTLQNTLVKQIVAQLCQW